jgi:long-chain acyl-CoA synthetase
MLVPVQYQRLMAGPSSTATTCPASVQVLHQRAVSAALKADVLRAGPAAGRVLRHDRRRRQLLHPKRHLHPDKLHTVGQPAEGHDIRLIDEAGRELPPARRARWWAIRPA